MKSKQLKDKQRRNKIISNSGQNVSSLTNKIIEQNLRQNNDEYQHLLIRQKQLQLELLEQENINKQMLKDFSRKKSGVQIMKNQLQKARNECEKKKNYLQQYYTYLDKKLKSSSPANINMFKNLEYYSKGLKQKQNKQEDNLQGDIKQLQIQLQKLVQQLQIVQQSKNKINQQYEQRRIKKQNQRLERERKRMEKKKQRQQQIKQQKQLQIKIQKIKKQRQELQDQQNKLKKLLNIQQQHKKYWLKIESALKKQLVGKLRQKKYKQAMGLEYSMKIPQYKSLLNQRKYQKQILVQQLDERKKHLQQIKTNMNQSLIKYSQLQGQMLTSSQKKN